MKKLLIIIGLLLLTGCSQDIKIIDDMIIEEEKPYTVISEKDYWEIKVDMEYHPIIYCVDGTLKLIIQKSKETPSINPEYKRNMLNNCFLTQ